MSAAREKCIWFDQCGPECLGCGDYTPADESEGREAYYRGILRENALEYGKIVRDFQDREDVDH